MDDNQVIIPLMGESNFSDPINTSCCEKCEKCKKEVIVMEESLRRYIDIMASLSTILCLVLVILPILKTSSDGANFIEKYQNIIAGLIFFIVTLTQLELFSIATIHSFNSIIFGIIFMIMIPFFTPVVELSLFSVIYCILWAITIVAFLIALWEWISKVKILYSQWKSRNP